MTTSFRTIVRGSLVVFGLAALSAQGANAATVTTIFNTGVLTNDPTTGAPATFSPVGSVDTHYTVATLGSTLPGAPASGGFASAFILNPTTFPGSLYPNTATSRNISVAANGIGTGNTFYDYRTTFDLTGFSTTGASLQGLVFGDNNVPSVFLNGVLVSSPVNNGGQYPFTITSAFNGGINTLDFIVQNFADGQGNPEFTAFNGDTLRLSANTLPAVPEPGSVAMLVGLGVTGAGFLARRKRVSK